MKVVEPTKSFVLTSYPLEGGLNSAVQCILLLFGGMKNYCELALGSLR